MDEFLWAFSIVSSRHLVFNNQQSDDDPNLVLMIMPLLDFINHSFDPNVVALPYHDRVNNESFVLLQALKDIEKDEQLCMSYGNLSNTHLIQKYGFTTESNEHNKVSGNLPYHEFEAMLFEETDIKRQISQRLKLPFNTQGIQAQFYPHRFDTQTLKQLRVNFLTSKNLIDYGTQHLLN